MNIELIAKFRKVFSSETTIDFQLHESLGERSVTALFGPSGCGKTTVLRCIAGLERPNSGIISFDGQCWFDQENRIHLRPQKREVGFLFQEYALFPHKTVVGNLAYGLRGMSRDEQNSRVEDVLQRFDLKGLESRFPSQISGGQQQRVALARVMACRPQLLLLDEPLSALDATLRAHVRSELREMMRAYPAPTIVVTHDRAEASALADQVVIMNEGLVRQIGTPDEVFRHPVDSTVATIAGVETIVQANVENRNGQTVTVNVAGRRLKAQTPSEQMSDALVCIRAEDVQLALSESEERLIENSLECHIACVVPEGPIVRVKIDAGFELTALLSRPLADRLALKVGDQVSASIDPAAVHLVAK